MWWQKSCKVKTKPFQVLIKYIKAVNYDLFIVKFFLYIVQLSSRLRQASWRTCYSIGLENYIGTVPRVLYSTVNKLCCPEYKAWLYKCSYSFHVIPCRPFYFNISVSSHSKCNFLPPQEKKTTMKKLSLITAECTALPAPRFPRSSAPSPPTGEKDEM